MFAGTILRPDEDPIYHAFVSETIDEAMAIVESIVDSENSDKEYTKGFDWEDNTYYPTNLGTFEYGEFVWGRVFEVKFNELFPVTESPL